MTRDRVDGIFINRWAGSGMCYCEHCRTNFRAATGHELPVTVDPQDPARRAYIVWHQQRLFELWRLWDTEVRKINPDSCVIPNAGGGATSPLDMKTIGALAPTLFADRQPERLTPPGPMARAQGSIGRDGGKPSAGSSAWAWRRRTAGRTRSNPRPRFGSGSPTGSRTACDPGSRSSPACSATAAGSASSRSFTAGISGPGATCEPGASGRVAPSTRSKPPGSTAANAPEKVENHGPGGIRHLSRPVFLRDGPRPVARTPEPGPIQDAHPAERRRAVRRAMPAARRVRRARERGRDL